MNPVDLFISLIVYAYFTGALIVLLIVLPWALMGRITDMDIQERLWLCFLLGSGYLIALGLILAPLHMHDTLGYGLASFAIFAIYMKFVKRIRLRVAFDRLLTRFIGLFFDYLDNSSLFSTRVGGVIGIFASRSWGERRANLNPSKILIWAFFLYAFYLRAYDSMAHYSFGFFDPFVHLLWLKEYNLGNVFYDGLYSRGYHAFLSAIGTLTALDPDLEIRFAGGIFGALIPLSLFFLMKECQIPWTASLAGLSLLVIQSPISYIVRQTASLPQEFALVYLIAALAFGVRYLRLGRKRDRIAFFIGIFVAAASHTMVGITIFIAGIPLAIDYLMRPDRIFRRLGLLIREAIAGVFLGVLPLIIGKLWGIQVNRSASDYLQFIVNAEGSSALKISIWTKLTQSLGICIPLLILIAALLVFYGFSRRRGDFPSPAFLCLWAIMQFGIWAMNELFDRPVPFPSDRALIILTLPLCGVIAYSYQLIVEALINPWRNRPWIRAGVVAATVIALICIFYLPPPEPIRPQFDPAAKLYYDLVRDLPTGSWTIVGQAEEFDLALNRGFHMNLGDFLHQYQPDKTTLIFPTYYVFIVHEIVPKKELLDVNTPIWVERRNEEKRLQSWLDIYAALHNNLHVYYKTDDLAIYAIYNNKILSAGESMAKL